MQWHIASARRGGDMTCLRACIIIMFKSMLKSTWSYTSGIKSPEKVLDSVTC